MSLRRVLRLKSLIVRVSACALVVLSYSTALAKPQPTQATPQTPPHKATKQRWALKKADIRAVIQAISEVTGKTFIVDPRVQGRITLISQKPMSASTLYQAFLSMLDVMNYTAIPSGKVIKIVPAMKARQSGLKLGSQGAPGQGDEPVVRVVPVYNVPALQLIPILRPLMQDWANVSAYTPSNSLILAGNAGNLKRLIAIIRNLDQKNQTQIQIVRLKYANATKLAQVIQNLQSATQSKGQDTQVAIAPDAEDNSILVSGNLTAQLKMRQLITRLDNPSKQVTNQLAVFNLNYLSAKKIAPILMKVVAGEKGTAPILNTKGKEKTTYVDNSSQSVSIQSDEVTNTLIVRAPSTTMKMLRNIIKQLDVKPQQVLVEAIIVKVDQNLLDNLGIKWGMINQASPDATGLTNSVLGTLSTGGTFGFLPNMSLAALIDFLKSNGSSEILATPSIVVLNNAKATIADGKNIGIINRQYSSTSVGSNNEITPYNTIERKDVTLSLTVTPQISPNDMIRFKIQQQNNTIDPSADGQQSNPTFDVSKIDTSVMVHSGNILVLGGLINQDKKRTVSKVPLLGDIPLLGKLFQHTNTQTSKTNLMVFIKPIILKNNAVANNQTQQRYRYMEQQSQRYEQRKILTDTRLSNLARNRLLPAPAATQ